MMMEKDENMEAKEEHVFPHCLEHATLLASYAIVCRERHKRQLRVVAIATKKAAACQLMAEERQASMALQAQREAGLAMEEAHHRVARAKKHLSWERDLCAAWALPL